MSLDLQHGVPDRATADAVRALAAGIEHEDGAPPLSDRALSRLQSDTVAHLVVRDGDAIVGYGARSGDELDLAADPAAAGLILDSLTGPVLVWSHGEQSRLAPVLDQRGFARERELLQLRRSVDVALPADPPLPSGVTVRTFEPGRDEEAWVAVNAAAFATHPEQGQVTRADLLALETEDWFDPDGFLLAHDGEELVGYHWTKIHSDGAGEVYVLGIAPAAQGSGLGNALLMRGLRSLVERGVGYLMLYVEGDSPAVRLYERAGFARHNLDIQWQLS